jgi:hypothetical protein
LRGGSLEENLGPPREPGRDPPASDHVALAYDHATEQDHLAKVIEQIAAERVRPIRGRRIRPVPPIGSRAVVRDAQLDRVLCFMEADADRPRAAILNGRGDREPGEVVEAQFLLTNEARCEPANLDGDRGPGQTLQPVAEETKGATEP